MAVGLSATQANGILEAIGNATNYTAPTAIWIKLHLGDPGSAGTANPAAETTRQQASFGAASGGVIASDADLTWTNVSNSETYSHISAWTANAAGTFIFSDDLAASKAVTAGDTFTIASGDLTIAITVLAA